MSPAYRHPLPTFAVLTAFFAVTAAASGCGPGDDCTVTLTCKTGSGGSMPTTSSGGHGATGGGELGGGGAGGSAPGTLGAPCGPRRNATAVFCADGVCCAAACDGVCEACDMAGACTPQAAATDPDTECTGGVCDGAGQCATGAHVWSKRFGDAAADTLDDLAVGTSGIGLVGTYSGTPEFGLGPLPMGGSFALVLTTPAPRSGTGASSTS